MATQIPGDRNDNSAKLDRRQFIAHVSKTTIGLWAVGNLPTAGTAYSYSTDTDALLDWSLWERYRDQVQHPVLAIKKVDIAKARENIKRYPWARNYAVNIEKYAQLFLHLVKPEALAGLIEETTPGDPLWTPCPACRDQGKPVHPHGLWEWDIAQADEIKCTVCKSTFPNAKYPEDVVLKTKWGKPQNLTFLGGDPFVIFGFMEGRPSFTANIRARKVQWMINYARMLAEAFTVSKKPAYAIACRDILLRFAECYPNWLIHVGYGEYADMDPRTAALHIKNLPQPELTPPPNKPDAALWTGHWSAGRASGVGLESDFIRKAVEAYDLTCTASHSADEPVYSDEQRKKIERDLLLESTILLVCDKLINNKSVSNRTAVALVGMCTGHPELVRFGLEGFGKTVNDWFLPDGATSESPFYGLMTLGGIWDMAQAARGYSDPVGYTDQSGKRMDSLNLYDDMAYKNVWAAFFNGLQGDLNYPPYADSFRNLKLDPAYVELMVANYPQRKEYLALLKKLCGNDLSIPSGPIAQAYYGDDLKKPESSALILPYDLAKPNSTYSFSVYYRAPGLENTASPALTLKDWCPADLRIGHMRTGPDGRESLLTLSASHYRGHHERDSLNLYYWKKGCEILSDLGYLWDHPLKYQTTMRTLAHNTVLINEKEQRAKERGGTVHHFFTDKHVKMMEASSEAYQETSVYRRTSAIIDHGNGDSYVIDFFTVKGGDKQDYVFHTHDTKNTLDGITLSPLGDRTIYDLTNVQSGKSSGVWRITWQAEGALKCTAWSVAPSEEEVFMGDGWGQRDWKNTDIGATVPYFIRRTTGDSAKTFISVFEGYDSAKPFVRNVRFIDGALIIDTAAGTDHIMCADQEGVLPVKTGNEINNFPGHFVCASVKNGKLNWHTVVQ